VNLVAEERVFFALVPPRGVSVGGDPRAATLPLAGTGLLAKLVGICPKMSGIDAGIAPGNDL